MEETDEHELARHDQPEDVSVLRATELAGRWRHQRGNESMLPLCGEPQLVTELAHLLESGSGMHLPSCSVPQLPVLQVDETCTALRARAKTAGNANARRGDGDMGKAISDALATRTATFTCALRRDERGGAP